MRVTYDGEADAAYISLKDLGAGESRHQILVEAEEARGEIVLDLDAEGKLIGIEVLNARSGLPTDLLNEAERL
jgi:uncharacterized protein YuzE